MALKLRIGGRQVGSDRCRCGGAFCFPTRCGLHRECSLCALHWPSRYRRRYGMSFPNQPSSGSHHDASSALFWRLTRKLPTGCAPRPKLRGARPPPQAITSQGVLGTLSVAGLSLLITLANLVQGYGGGGFEDLERPALERFSIAAPGLIPPPFRRAAFNHGAAKWGNGRVSTECPFPRVWAKAIEFASIRGCFLLGGGLF